MEEEFSLCDMTASTALGALQDKEWSRRRKIRGKEDAGNFGGV